MNNDIELFLKVDESQDEIQKFKSDLLGEQHKRFLVMTGQLDECEKLVGTWNPANKFNNLYETMDTIYDEIDEFNANNEDSKIAPTPTAGDRLGVP